MGKIDVSITFTEEKSLQLLERMMHLPPAQWDQITAEELQNSEDAIRSLDMIVIKAAIASRYLELRGGEGTGDRGHTSALLYAMRVRQKIRKALGYYT